MTARTALARGAKAALLLLVAPLLAAALAPWWIGLDPVRTRAAVEISKAAGGGVRIERIDFSWLPGPAVTARGVVLSIPGAVRGTVRSVAVSAAFLPLLAGKVRLGHVAVEGADLAVEAGEPGPQKEDPLAPLRSLASGRDGTAVEVRESRFTLARRSATLASVEGLELSVRLRERGSRELHAEAAVKAARLDLHREGRRPLAVEGVRVEGSVGAGEDGTAIVLSRLSVASPRLSASGRYQAGPAPPRAELALRGETLDVTGLRRKLVPFAGDVPLVAAIFDLLRGGTLSAFSLDSRGDNPADLGLFERMVIRATVAGGMLHFAGPGLDLEAVRGDVSIDGGVLSARNAAAEVGPSRALEGTVLVGLGGGDDRLQVEARVEADLAHLPALLARVVPDRSFVEELSLVEGLEGSARGRVALSGTLRKTTTLVSVSEMRLSARYARIPWPLRIDRGGFSFDGTRVGLDRLEGSAGGSSFSGLSASVLLSGPAIEKLSGTAEGSLAELHAGFTPRAETEPREGIRRIEGRVRLSVSRLSGPFFSPREWAFQAAGSFADVALDASFLPAPLEARVAEGTVDETTVRMARFDARTMDAVLHGFGTVRGYRETRPTIEASAEGEAGAEALRWLWAEAGLPGELLPRAPIAFHEARFTFAPPGTFSLAGLFTPAGGPRVTLDLAADREAVELRDLSIADGDGVASLSYRRDGEGLALAFRGRLAGSSVARILATERKGRGRLEGDFRVFLPREQPGAPKAEGTLSAADLEIPTPAGPATIECLEARGEGSRLVVSSSSIALDGERFAATGSAHLAGRTVELDADVAAGDLSWDWVERTAAQASRPHEGTAEGTVASSPTAGTAPLSLSGTVRFSLDSFAYPPLVWRGVLLDVALGLDGASATAAVRSADLCGIRTTGTARFVRGEVAVDARAEAAGPDIAVPLSCLGLGETPMTGAYEGTLHAEASGTPSDLLRSAHGPLAVKVTNGTLGKVGVLTRILGVINGTEVFAGKGGGRLGEAMPFREVSVEGEVADGGLSIREALVAAPSLTMVGSGRVVFEDRSLDLMVLSQPLSTLDKAVQAVPVVRHILGKDFLSVAARVTGTVSDPKVKVTPGKDAGVGLVKILERTVKLPVTVFDPPTKPEPQ